MDKLFELDYETRSFKPTVEWMSKRYDEANQKLFNGSLKQCDFGLFTTGSGSRGNTNGWFRITARGLKYNSRDRRLYKEVYGYEKVYVNYDNFYEIAHPKIELNGNKSGSEWAFMVTLVHEMCHYYNYMYGHLPAQAHGREFMSIANAVTRRSNGQIEVTKKTTLERSQHFVLDDKVKQINDKIANTRKSKATLILKITKKGNWEMSIVSSPNIVQEIVDYTKRKKDATKVIKTNDQSVIDAAIENGFRKIFRTYRYWTLKNKDWLKNALESADIEEVYVDPEFSGESLVSVKPKETPKPQPNPTQPKIIFSIKTTSGVFETSCNSFVELREKLQQRFPKMSYETISKLMGNRSNFKKLEENHMNSKQIVKEVIEEFMQNEFRGADNLGDDIEITPDMNLSEFSPLEIE